MSDKTFIDSNIILYLYSEDEKDKRDTAERTLISSNAIISTQVINEISNILFRKFLLSANDIQKVIKELDGQLPIVHFGLQTQLDAVNLKVDYQIQYYDSLILATALEQDCSILYSEDMQHTLKVRNKITIINPFV